MIKLMALYLNLLDFIHLENGSQVLKSEKCRI